MKAVEFERVQRLSPFLMVSGFWELSLHRKSRFTGQQNGFVLSANRLVHLDLDLFGPRRLTFGDADIKHTVLELGVDV